MACCCLFTSLGDAGSEEVEGLASLRESTVKAAKLAVATLTRLDFEEVDCDLPADERIAACFRTKLPAEEAAKQWDRAFGIATDDDPQRERKWRLGKRIRDKDLVFEDDWSLLTVGVVQERQDHMNLIIVVNPYVGPYEDEE